MNKKYLTANSAWALLLAIFIIGIIHAPVAAENSKEIELQKIIVTNRRTPVGLSETTENVVVVNEEEIKQLPARDLSEVLNYIPGVYVEPGRGFGRATSVSIQGSDSRQVRVMIDGIPLNTQASGQVNPSKFPIEDIARIEVIKGSASSIWGSALGGVINIITKDTGNSLIPEGSITNTFAEFRTQKHSFDLSGKALGLGYYIFSSYMESGGNGPKDDILEKKSFGKLSYDLEEQGKITGSFGFSEGDVNSGVLPDNTWEAHPYRCQYGKVGWEGNVKDSNIRIDLKRSRQDIISDYFLSVDDEAPYLAIKSKDLLYQLSLNSSTRLRGKDLLVLGVDFDSDTLKSTYLTKAKNLKLQAPYANYSLKLNPWDFNFGLRYDRNSEFGQDISPSFGCVYHLGSREDTLIRLNISRAFNAPPLLWKYYIESLSGLTTNPDLGPERAMVYELGLESQPVARVWLKLSLYKADISDAISNAKNLEGKWIKKNFEEFRRQGIEAEVRLKLFEDLSFFGSGAFNDIENRTTGETVKDADSPRQSFDLGFEYKNKIGTCLYINGRYDYWNKTFDIFQPKDRKFIFDLKARQKVKNLTCFLNIYNIFDSEYWSDFYNPIPRRYFEGGFSIDW
ncbi:MAG: TonB-dependent receptor [Candidatus Omnitrophica bacterium]|nr:TonB-dependent receptor [Candidatus Omnitrophota bacterium]